MENTPYTTFRLRVPTANPRHQGAALVDSEAIHGSAQSLDLRNYTLYQDDGLGNAARSTNVKHRWNHSREKPSTEIRTVKSACDSACSFSPRTGSTRETSTHEGGGKGRCALASVTWPQSSYGRSRNDPILQVAARGARVVTRWRSSPPGWRASPQSKFGRTTQHLGGH